MASHVYEHQSHDQSLGLISKMIGILKDEMPELKKSIEGDYSNEQREDMVNELLISIAESHDLTADIVVPGEAFRRARKRQLGDSDAESVSQPSRRTRRARRRERSRSSEHDGATQGEDRRRSSSVGDSVIDDVDSEEELEGHPDAPDLYEKHFYGYMRPPKKPKAFVSEADNNDPYRKSAMIVARKGRINRKRCSHCVRRGTYCLVKNGYKGCSQCIFHHYAVRCDTYTNK